MKRAIIEKSGAPRYLSILLVIQSASIIGFFSTNRFPRVVEVVSNDLQKTITDLTDTVALLIAVAVALIARGISFKRKRAWQLATVLQTLLIFMAIFHNAHRLLSHQKVHFILFGNFGLSHLIFEIAILIFLITKREVFNTVTDPHTRKSDIKYFFQVSAISVIVAIIIIYFDRNKFIHPLTTFQIFETAIKGLVGVSGPVAYLIPKNQERVENLLIALGIFIVASTIVRALRPVERIVHMSALDKSAISELIAKYPSDDSLAYFALRDDKDVIWAKNGKAAITYSVIQGTMIASGDPLGDPECWPSAIEEFIAEATRHAWTPTVYGCTEKAGEIWWRETECDALEIGDEAIIIIEDFNIDTPGLKSVRQMANKARKEGYEVTVKKICDISATERNTLSKLAQEWRRGGDERGFSMALGRFCDSQDPDALIAWASVNGNYKGLLQFVPWGIDGLSLDLMRRSHDAISGVNELLIASTIEYGRLHGISRISLNFATFRSIFEKGERLGAGPITRLSHRILILLSRFVQMESLYRFNAKFQPQWEPRYILFPSIRHLGRIAIAILRIESFLPNNRRGSRLKELQS